MPISEEDRQWVRDTVAGAVTALIDADLALAKRVEGLEEMFLGRGYADVARDADGVVRVQKPIAQENDSTARSWPLRRRKSSRT